MVALHQRWEAADEPTSVYEARREVERLGAGLSRALLATPPDELRAIAERAATAEAAVERWKARVGERPDLDPSADAAVVDAVAEVTAARADQNLALFERHRLLAIGNATGVLAMGAAGGLVALGVPPMELPVAIAVVSAAGGPLTAAFLATQRCSLAARRVGAARARWAEALRDAGAETMGALAARRVAVVAWERRTKEADAAGEAARPNQRAWYRLAGPGVPPTDADLVLERIESLRHSQLRLLGALLAERVERSAMSILAPPSEVARPSAPPSWLDRVRGNKLRLWPS